MNQANYKVAQRGVALISAVVVAALVTVATVALTSDQHMDVRRTSNLLDAGQAKFYVLGMESWGLVVLARDSKESEVDHLGEDWATLLEPTMVTGGQVSGYVEDLEGRFNLNNLLQKDQESPADRRIFERLLTALELDPQLVLAVLDWMDADIEARFPNGAEDEVYLSRSIPYRVANQPLTSVSELALIQGFDAEMVNALRPYVTVLPEVTTINVNTAKAPVIRALADGISESEATTVVEDRPPDGYPSITEFLQHSVFAGREVNQGGLALASRHFLIRSQVDLGNVRTRISSWVQRSVDGKPRVYARLASVE